MKIEVSSQLEAAMMDYQRSNLAKRVCGVRRGVRLWPRNVHLPVMARGTLRGDFALE